MFHGINFMVEHSLLNFVYILSASTNSYTCNFQRMLEGYKFPVNTTKVCPRNESEWNHRSSVFNCSKESTYACFPNGDITELIEFCYPIDIIAIQKGKHMLRPFSQ